MLIRLLTLAALCALAIGCGSNAKVVTPKPEKPSPAPTPREVVDPLNKPTPSPQNEGEPKDNSNNFFTNPKANNNPPKRGLGDLLETPEGKQEFGRVNVAPMPIDEERAQAHGIRKISGKYVTLYTNLPESPAIEELPTVFDLAVPQWAARFNVSEEKIAGWKMSGFLMRDRESFRKAGLLPSDLPDFRQGYQLGLEFWFDEQEEDYYRRHLMLHEGTHGFMKIMLGGAGPPWYMEGMAEIMATHTWENNKLTLNVMPQTREESPGWGRIRIVQDEYKAGRGMTPSAILQYGPNAHLQNAPYGWSWALCWFFDNHPKYQQAFRDLQNNVRNETLSFSTQFYSNLKEQWPEIKEQWMIFVLEIDYGYELAPAIVMHEAKVLGRPEDSSQPLQSQVNAARGWQSTGIELTQGASYEIAATGKFQLKSNDENWESTADGVSIEYHRHHRLGVLMGAVRPQNITEDDVSFLASGEPLGAARSIVSPRSGMLYVRINEAAGELADNYGELNVYVRPVE